MQNKQKMIFYEVNPRFFKDQNGDGIGDLKGLIANFQYFNHLGIDAIILQDVLATDLSHDQVSYIAVAPEIGDVNDLLKVVTLAKKYAKKIILEINIGTIYKNNSWFAATNDNVASTFYKVVNFKSRKENPALDYAYSKDHQKYFIYDTQTQEIPLNWKSHAVLNNFLKVIAFWKDIGIAGFVFEKFEYLADEAKVEMMHHDTVIAMKKLYHAVKKLDENLILIGQSPLVKINHINQYTNEGNKIFDYFMSTRISMIGLSHKYGLDAPGFFSPKMYAFYLNDYIKDCSNILTFNSKAVGKVLSRWTNDGAYIQESAKALAILLMLNNTSPSIYCGDEIGLPNIGLTKHDDLQTPDLAERKLIALRQKITEQEFYQAQSANNPLNARALMIWNDEKNGGFSSAKQTITPVSLVANNINVKIQYQDKASILNFYRKLIQLVTSSSLSKLMREGAIKSSNLFPGVIKYTITWDNQQVTIIVNLTSSNKMNMFSKWGGKVILSSYGNKIYHKIPKILGPYEGIVISRHSPQYIKTPQQIKIEKLQQTEREKHQWIKAQNQAKHYQQQVALAKQQVQEQAIQDKIKQAQAEEKAQILQKHEAHKARGMPPQKASGGVSTKGPEKPASIQSPHADTPKDTHDDPYKTTTKEATQWEDFKQSIKTKHDGARSHLDEATKLKDEEVAKTTLIDDTIDLDELFDSDETSQ